MGLVTGEPSQSSSAAPSTGKPPTKREELVQKAHSEFGWPKEELASKSDRQLVRIVHKEEHYEKPQNGHALAAAASEPEPQPGPAKISEEEKRKELRTAREPAAPQATAVGRTTFIDHVRGRSSGNGAVIFVVLVLILLLILAFTQGWLPRFWEQAATPSLRPVATASSAPTATTASTASPTPVAAVKQNFLVQDANGNPVEGVKVWAVLGQDRTPDATSNSRGEVTLDLKPGQSYRISASKDGFDLYNSENLITAGSAPISVSIKMAPAGTASERGRPGTDTSGFVAPNADTRDQAIEGAMFYGSRNGGIDSPSQVRSVSLTTIPTANWRTAFRDGNLIGFRSGSDLGDKAWVILTTDGRVFYIQVKCSNLVIPPQLVPTPTPAPVVTPRTPTPSSPPCCVVVPTPTPTPTPTKNPSNAPPTFAPPTGPVTAPPTVTPLPISYELSIVGSEPCGSGCWRVRWRASNVTPTSANGWVVYGVVGYFTGERVNGSPDGAGNWVAEMRPLESGRTYQFQAYTAPPSGPSKATGIQTFIAP